MDITGFSVETTFEVAEYNAKITLLKHEKTQADVVVIENDDANNAFAASFRTASFSNTGVAHILEHSVLCGTQKYPVKEVFVELLKGSVNTFLNAFTFPDKTVYPFSTTNNADYLNLQSVYLDAVLNPSLDERFFKQEGWHYEFNEADKLVYKGVVYNEMKGAYSNPDRYLFAGYFESLFPDTIYSRDSGGDPRDIPKLTYQQFKDFHAAYYHPSNAQFFLYGNQNMDERLALLNSYLDAFEYLDIMSVSHTPLQNKFKTINSYITPQQPFLTSKEDTVPYPSDTYSIVTAYNIGNNNSAEHFYLGMFISRLLTGNPSSPLRRIIEESGLGEEFYGGDPDAVYHNTFVYGLKGVKQENLAQAKELFQVIIEETISIGFTPKTIAATLNQMEYDLKTMQDDLPVGLNIILQALSTSNYEGSIESILSFQQYIDALKEYIADPQKILNILNTVLLQNPQHTTVLYTPDTAMLDAMEKEENAKLEDIRVSLSDEEIEKIKTDQIELEKWQQTPDSEKALATIPRLSISDMIREVTKDEYDVIDDSTLLHTKKTRGISYVDWVFDMQTVPMEWLQYIPIMLQCLGKVHTKRPYHEVLEDLALYTGNWDFDVVITTDPAKKVYAKIFAQVECVNEYTTQAVHLLNEIMTQSTFDDEKIVLQVVSEYKSYLKSVMVSNGSNTILKLLHGGRSKEGWLEDKIRGYTFYRFLEQLEKDIAADFNHVSEIFTKTFKQIFVGDYVQVNIVSEYPAHVYDIVKKPEHALPKKSLPINPWDPTPVFNEVQLDWPTQVNFIAQTWEIPNGTPFNASYDVVMKYLSRTFLWNQVRIQGGAYGCKPFLDQDNHIFSIASYRDPHHQRTLGVYNSIVKNLLEVDLEEHEMEQLIISTLGLYDAYALPHTQGVRAFIRHMHGTTEEERQEKKDKVFATTIEDFREFGNLIKDVPTETGLFIKKQATTEI